MEPVFADKIFPHKRPTRWDQSFYPRPRPRPGPDAEKQPALDLKSTEGPDPVFSPASLAGDSPGLSRHSCLPLFWGWALPRGEGNTAPVTAVVFPGTENRLIYPTLPQPPESSDPLSVAPETRRQHSADEVISGSSTRVSQLIWLNLPHPLRPTHFL